MHKRMSIILVYLLTLSLVLTMVGCTTPTETEVPTSAEPAEPTDAPAPVEPVVMRVGGFQEPDCMTNMATCATIFWLSELIWESFYGFGPDCSPLLPRQAESYELSNENKTFTFHLVDGITWNDGEVFDANDIVQHWDWITNTSINDWYWATSRAVSWEALDDLTFQLTLEVPDSGFVNGYAQWLWVLPPQVYGDFEEDDIWDYATDQPVSTGPYVITEWVRGSYIIFDARPDYYLGKPPVDRIIVEFFANEDAAVQALISGEIDVIPKDLSPQYYDTLKAEPNITMYERDSMTRMMLDFNSRAGVETKHPALDDPVVHEAIDYAIDKQKIVDIPLLGHAYTCPTAWTCGPLYQWGIDPSLQVFPQDFEKANQLLTDAGYIDTDGDGVRETPDGLPMVLSLFFNVDYEPQRPIADMIKDWIEQIGIQIEVEGMEESTLLSRQQAMDYDLAIRVYGADWEPGTMGDLQSCAAPLTFTGYCSEEYDTALHNVQTHYGEERLPYIYKMSEALQADRPYIMLAGVIQLGGYRNDRFEMPSDPCGNYGGLLSWYAVMSTVVK